MAALFAASAAIGLGRRGPIATAAVAGALGARHVHRWGARSLRDTGGRSAHGGSAFEPVLPTSPTRLPLALATVLFRPHLLEARTLRMRLVALEGAFLALLTLTRLRGLPVAASDPYGRFALAFTGLFGVAYSGVGNFGLLATHRTQVLPLALVPLSLRPGGAA
jgi:hypothetical protein